MKSKFKNKLIKYFKAALFYLYFVLCISFFIFIVFPFLLEIREDFINENKEKAKSDVVILE